jgi:hypothetical protein
MDFILVSAVVGILFVFILSCVVGWKIGSGVGRWIQKQ